MAALLSGIPKAVQLGFGAGRIRLYSPAVRPYVTAENSNSNRGGQRLDSWKAIAAYLKRDVRTVQRWERYEHLPVHRKLHGKLSSIYAYTSELDAWWGEGHSGRPSEPAPDPGPLRPLLAVLPLRNLSGNHEQDYFSEGLTEELISQLSRLNPQQLGVIARGSAMRYKDTAKDIHQIARELGVSYILDGSVRRNDDRVRIAVQLVGVRDQSHLWAESYDHSLRDILELQSEVARAVTEQIALTLSAREQERLRSSRPIAPEAYESYLRGRFFWNQRSADGLQRATDLFERAITIDAGYAPAHAGLADCYALLSTTAVGALKPAVAMPKAEAAANRALELDPRLAEAHTSLAYAQLFFDWDWSSAEASFRRALDFNPGYATAHHWYAEYLTTLGRTMDSLEEFRRAQELDPLSLAIPSALASNFYFERDYDRVIEHSRRTLEADPNFVLAYLNLGRAYSQKRMHRQAIAELKKVHELSPDSAAIKMTLGHAYGVAGKKAEAMAILDRLRRLAKQRYVPAFYFAALYSGLGDVEQSFKWLAKARDERCDYFVYLDREPDADPLRPDPRFHALVPRPPSA
jgi:TolB-like protein/Tfp pilus assembly protein PilF